MIARRARLREVVRRDRADGSVSLHAHLDVEAVEFSLLLRPEEYEAAKSAIAKGASLVLSIAVEVAS